MARILKISAMAAISIALLSGCATTSSPARIAYYKVPCGTPGAVVAEPVLEDPAAASQELPAGAEGSAAATCIVGVSDPSRGYRGFPGYYGRPYYGSVGIGLGFGFHGGHHRGHSIGHGGHARGH